jgi:hypothetical protein
MRRIHPTRRERRAKGPPFMVSQLSFTERWASRLYSGRPTRKQRQRLSLRGVKVHRAFKDPHGERRKPFRYHYTQQELLISGIPVTGFRRGDAVENQNPETYDGVPSNLQSDHVGINAAGEFELATHEPIQTITVSATPPTEEQRRNREAPTITITINGEQVPATIVKDPTK